MKVTVYNAPLASFHRVNWWLFGIICDERIYVHARWIECSRFIFSYTKLIEIHLGKPQQICTVSSRSVGEVNFAMKRFRLLRQYLTAIPGAIPFISRFLQKLLTYTYTTSSPLLHDTERLSWDNMCVRTIKANPQHHLHCLIH